MYAHAFSESNVAGNSIFQTVHFLVRNENRKYGPIKIVIISQKEETRIHILKFTLICNKALFCLKRAQKATKKNLKTRNLYCAY